MQIIKSIAVEELRKQDEERLERKESKIAIVAVYLGIFILLILAL